MKIILILGFGSIGLFLLAGLLAPIVLRSRKKVDQTQAISNVRQIGVALFEFESEYGKFPDETTRSEVKRRASSEWDLKSETSNDLFKQLIVAGLVSSEEIFYAKGEGVRKSDHIASTETRALSLGECGFAYLPPGELEGLNPARPLVVAPLIPGTLRFDPKAFEGKAVVLKADLSVQSYRIGEDGRIMLGGKDVFDPSQVFWKGRAPVIKWQDVPATTGNPFGPLSRMRWALVLLGAFLLVSMAFFARSKLSSKPV